MLFFGGNLTGFSVINYFARNLDNLLIGKVWGSQQLGFYAKAYQLLLLPIDQINSPISAVAVPALSRLADSPDRYRQAYMRIMEKVAILTMPTVAFMMATSDWMVRIVLGPQWAQASVIFALLGIAGLIQPVAGTTGWLFITQNRTRHMFYWGVIASAIIMASIVAGIAWGSIGVAASYSLTFVLVIAPLLFWYVGREGPVRIRDFYLAIAPAATAAILVLAALFGFRSLIKIENPFVGIAVSLGIGTLVTFLALLISLRGRNALLDFKNSAALLLKGKLTKPS